MDWDNPKTLNEKIQWLKFYSDTTIWTLLADKYRVRDYVKQCGCENLLVNLYGVWDDAKKIDWNSLPQKFVMKSNCSCGDIRICLDKLTIDRAEWEKHFAKAMANKNGYERGEPHYNKIKPVVIAEELLDVTKQSINSSSLIDYKIWCFNGIPHYIFTCCNRTKDVLEIGLYDKDWNYHPEKLVFTKQYIESSQRLPKPKSLEIMLECAKRLSNGLPQVRVDLYEVDGKPYFGEMTMTSASGFMNYFTEDFMLETGSLIKIK